MLPRFAGPGPAPGHCTAPGGGGRVVWGHGVAEVSGILKQRSWQQSPSLASTRALVTVCSPQNLTRDLGTDKNRSAAKSAAPSRTCWAQTPFLVPFLFLLRGN